MRLRLGIRVVDWLYLRRGNYSLLISDREIHSRQEGRWGSREVPSRSWSLFLYSTLEAAESARSIFLPKYMHVALLQRNTEVIRLLHLGELAAQKFVLDPNFEK